MSKHFLTDIIAKTKKASQRYQDLPEKEKEQLWKYGYEQYKNYPEDEKSSLL